VLRHHGLCFTRNQNTINVAFVDDLAKPGGAGYLTSGPDGKVLGPRLSGTLIPELVEMLAKMEQRALTDSVVSI
jgi:hypothetical protein